MSFDGVKKVLSKSTYIIFATLIRPSSVKFDSPSLKVSPLKYLFHGNESRIYCRKWLTFPSRGLQGAMQRQSSLATPKNCRPVSLLQLPPPIGPKKLMANHSITKNVSTMLPSPLVWLVRTQVSFILLTVLLFKPETIAIAPL